jgi:hypothetical protein
MLLKITSFIEVPDQTSLRSVENEIDLWIAECCEIQGDWVSRNDTSIEEQ